MVVFKPLWFITPMLMIVMHSHYFFSFHFFGVIGGGVNWVGVGKHRKLVFFIACYFHIELSFSILSLLQFITIVLNYKWGPGIEKKGIIIGELFSITIYFIVNLQGQCTVHVSSHSKII